MLQNENDTICAVATPPGVGGVSIVRVSGPDSFGFVDKVLKQRKPCRSYRGYTLHRAVVVDDIEEVDDVLISVFHNPVSFTGEDVVEISCHGGTVPVAKTLSLLIRAGCRPAAPGEFTRRAYLNGKLDLAQAEAVCDLINARTDEAYRLALSQRQGHLSKEIETVRGNLLGILARIEASIDFPEDVGELDFSSCLYDLAIAESALSILLAGADRGIMLRHGAQVVLVGRPNAGKSSLMNALLRSERAIVTAIPGTTRDTLEETINLNGIPVRLWDTAGLRTTDDPVELIGVQRSHAAIETADLVILVVDSSVGVMEEDHQIMQDVAENRLLTVWNKCDLQPGGALSVSAKAGEGLEMLERKILERLTGGTGAESSAARPALSHVHQRSAVEKALAHIDDAKRTITEEMPADFLSIDVRAALTALGQLTGQTAGEDIINEIFAKFCIGK